MQKTSSNESVLPFILSKQGQLVSERRGVSLIAEWEERRLRSQRLRLLSIDIEQECELLRCLSRYGDPRTPTSEQRSECDD
jgi:hypothetical protein